MAGAIGHVRNNSPFSSFKVKEWAPWMTEAVVLHFSGMSLPELSVRTGKSRQHLQNIMNTDQAKAVVLQLQRQALDIAVDGMADRIAKAKSKALGRVEGFLEDDELANEAPVSYWQTSLRTIEVLGKLTEAPAVVNNNTVNVQNNTLNISPAALERLRNTQGLEQIATSHHYESPPTPASAIRERTQELLGSGVSTTETQSEDRPFVALERSPLRSDLNLPDQHSTSQPPIRLVKSSQEI